MPHPTTVVTKPEDVLAAVTGKRERMPVRLEFSVDPTEMARVLLSCTAEQCSGGRLDPLIEKLQVAAQAIAARDDYSVYRHGRSRIGEWFFDTEGRPYERRCRALFESCEFKALHEKAEAFARRLQGQWASIREASTAAMRDITGLSFGGDCFRVFVVHPEVSVSRYLGQERIVWGGRGEWQRGGSDAAYLAVFMWHEMLHGERYLGTEDLVSHALIQLATDCELRRRLTGFSYPPLPAGHANLEPLMKRLLPGWQRYLDGRRESILGFRARLRG